MDVEGQKKAAALAACRRVKTGMVVGLGTGSTVQFALEELARRQRRGESFVGVATSRRTEEACATLGLRLAPLADHPALDVAIDGADEIDPKLNLIKGGGGALLREKVVASLAQEFLVIADESKFVPVLGSTFALPVEVVPFAESTIARRLAALGARPAKRTRDGQDVSTDNGNLILDARFDRIPNPPELERTIKLWPGVAEVGLFCGLASRAFLGTPSGVRELRPLSAPPANKRL